MRDPVIVRRPGVMGGSACFRGTRVNAETLFINIVDDTLDYIVTESFPTLDRNDCATALQQGAALIAEAGLMTEADAGQLFGSLAEGGVALDGVLARHPELGRDRCIAALRYAGAALAAAAECQPRREDLYPSADGPGAGHVVEVTVRVMVGPERSTVIVRRGRDPAVLNEVREHGREADGIGAAVEAALRKGIERG